MTSWIQLMLAGQLLLGSLVRDENTVYQSSLDESLILIDETEVTPHTESRGQKKVEEQEKPTMVQGGGYKTSEEIEKAPSEDHPCNLTRTTVKISFPKLRDELFVNFLGYREPNLVYLWRCKGLCGDTQSPVACGPTKITEKKVNMMFKVKTHLKGREPKDHFRELILDEHEECGCQCQGISASQCAGWFNEASCECQCEEKRFGEDKRRCESRTSTYWDARSCSCSSKSVAPRGTDFQPGYDCPGGGGDAGLHQPVKKDLQGLDMISWMLLGSCATISCFLAATTAFYRRKARLLQTGEKEQVLSKSREFHSGRRKERREKESRRKGLSWKYPQQDHMREELVGRGKEGGRSRSRSRGQEQVHSYLDLEGLDTGAELYHEQYDEHGVQIVR